ncbi:metallophosphoesterase family protein [Bacillus salipaludis]|uniref:Metallophosphoesterase family protein n=1 Tax=Bacillus salipaludis TaxID=2547811 RepID=A0ABW8RGV3_9BACI
MKHRIALLADVHGNVSALKAVVEDCIKEGVTDYWFLGDLIMPGPGANDDNMGNFGFEYAAKVRDKITKTQFLIIVDKKELGELDIVCIEQARLIFALELMRRKTALDTEKRLRGNFIDDLFSGLPL